LRKSFQNGAHLALTRELCVLERFVVSSIRAIIKSLGVQANYWVVKILSRKWFLEEITPMVRYLK
jgi:hypothetical protein